MQTGLQAEVLLCPNCKEEVPKTLYCLNCGYPLYKIELDQKEQEKITEEVVPEPTKIEPVLTSLVEVVNQIEEEIEKDSPVSDIVPEASPTELLEIEEVESKELEPEPMEELEIPPVIIDEEITSTIEIPDTDVDISVEPQLEDTKEYKIENVEVEEHTPHEDFEDTLTEIEPVKSESFEEELVIEQEVEEELVIEQEVEEEDTTEDELVEIEPTTKAESVEVELVPEEAPIFEIHYDPDPAVVELMKNFVKNMSMKIRLVNLLREGGVKTDIFNKLLENYVAHGELLMNSRGKMLERVKYDLSSMEKALNEAKTGLEELEIRRVINDVSDEEYAAKSPGFEWDIKQYTDLVGKKKAEILYLEDVTNVISNEEITTLENMGTNCLSEMTDLIDSGKLENEIANRVKLVLEEAISSIRA
jgi:hypothetical protein